MFNISLKRDFLVVSERNYCYPNPCVNKGNCVETKHSFICKCYKGFKGTTCSGINISTKCLVVSIGNNMVLSAIWEKQTRVSFSKTPKLHKSDGQVDDNICVEMMETAWQTCCYHERTNFRSF